MATTTLFLLRAISRKGLHNGLKAQARPSTPVQRAIWSLATPMFLNIKPAMSMTTKNCMPCTKYRLGTQVMGERVGAAGGGVLMVLFLLMAQFELRLTGDVPGAVVRPSSQACSAASAPSA